MNRDEIEKLLEGTTPGPWTADGNPQNRIVWSPDGNRVCFMAHSSGLNDDGDIANSNLVAAAPNLARTVIALHAQLADAKAAQAMVQALRAEIARKDQAIEAWREDLTNERADRDRLAAANATLEAQVARLVVDRDWQVQQRAQAMLRRHMNAPEDSHVEVLCERYGYGAVMDAASRLWARMDSMGAFYIGGCIGMKTDDEARAALAPAAPTGEDA